MTEGKYDAVTPPHYHRGPLLRIDIGSAITKGVAIVDHRLHCIEVMRCIQDPRLATALRYLWRVSFGGKSDPKHDVTQHEQDVEDIAKAIWYLRDWIDHPVVTSKDGGCATGSAR